MTIVKGAYSIRHTQLSSLRDGTSSGCIGFDRSLLNTGYETEKNLLFILLFNVWQTGTSRYKVVFMKKNINFEDGIYICV